MGDLNGNFCKGANNVKVPPKSFGELCPLPFPCFSPPVLGGEGGGTRQVHRIPLPAWVTAPSPEESKTALNVTQERSP